MATEQQAWEKWFEGVWAAREEHIYREIFGTNDGRIFTLPPQMFERMGLREVDPRWSTHGVLAYPPQRGKAGWAYVTSGLSNPWGQDPETASADGYSGLGMELVLLGTSEEGGEGSQGWAIQTLWWLMAMQILVGVGQVKGELLQYQDRVPLGASIDPKRPDALIRHLLAVDPAEAGLARGFTLASGKVDLILMVGMTDREAAFARTQGAEGLVNLLRHHGFFPETAPGRVSGV